MSFDASFETIVMDPGMEGGLKLTDDPADPGRLTFAGISSASWPGWSGWAVIESARKQGTLKSEGVRSVLLKLVQGFYKKEFWDCWKCGDLPDALAHELFEQSINLGHPRTCRHLQQVLNALNAEAAPGVFRYGADLGVDGAFGPKTLSRLHKAVADGRGTAIRNGLNALQGARYVELCLKNRARRRFAGGWLAKRAA